MEITPLDHLLPEGQWQKQAASTVPVVLVHGLFGFGRDEGLGFHYWGGFTDLQDVLRKQGVPTYTASMGPVSSNWDRAVELYYQIKGGCADYGEDHARTHGHARFVTGKCYSGFYPQWDAQHPVHLIGHSMGGTTALTLVQMLEQGFFGGARPGWVKSATTIASPNNGSSAAHVLLGFLPKLKEMVLAIGALAGSVDAFKTLYDFDLEQWGIRRQPGESFESYWNRVTGSKAWSSNDISSHDLSPEGAAAMRSWVKVSPGTYYFSYSANATSKGLISGWAYPKVTMNPVLMPVAYPHVWPLKPGVGNYTHASLGIDKNWWPNDGLVNTINMDAPEGTPTFAFDAAHLQKGRWYHVGLLNGYDHIDVIGITTFRDVRPLYVNHVGMLQGLP
ncbi:lipase [Deinococcus cellulosilyticus NBRC 106333 = KACC 11606]|uniref:triacylglycerol lipase n=2 Tax=Deinococcus cellulosilyticus TaxID=401558 RepID=A0A511N4C3_DEIC1|nr:lipase [Deinococcus cellulosilyticus NBRC 106333 = KACC 11606]